MYRENLHYTEPVMIPGDDVVYMYGDYYDGPIEVLSRGELLFTNSYGICTIQDGRSGEQIEVSETQVAPNLKKLGEKRELPSYLLG